MSKQYTNVEILDHLGELGDVRERLGAEDEDDTSRDNRINRMTAMELVRAWAGYNLGDESWGSQIVGLYKTLIKRGVVDD